MTTLGTIIAAICFLLNFKLKNWKGVFVFLIVGLMGQFAYECIYHNVYSPWWRLTDMSLGDGAITKILIQTIAIIILVVFSLKSYKVMMKDKKNDEGSSIDFLGGAAVAICYFIAILYTFKYL